MRNDGGPAFPQNVTLVQRNGDTVPDAGMTLRDYFAAAAIPLVVLGLKYTPRPSGMTVGEQAAQIAYEIAERMLAEREK